MGLSLKLKVQILKKWKEFAKSSVEGDPRDARDEMEYIYKELMSNIDAGKIKTPAIDKLYRYYNSSQAKK